MKRMRWLIVIALSLTVAGSSHAVDFGAKIGLVATDQEWDYTNTGHSRSFDDQIGVEVGAFVEYPVHNYFSLILEVHYVPIGVYYRVPAVGVMWTADLPRKPFKHIDYLSIPIYLKARIPSGGFVPFLFVGPRVDFKIGGDVEWFGDRYSEFKDVNLGLTVGAGSEHSLSPKMRLLFEVAYSPELAEVYKSELLTMKNRSLSFLVGVVF